MTRTALAPFGCKEIVKRYGEREDWSADELVFSKLPVRTMNDEQGISGSGKNKERDGEEQEDGRANEAVGRANEVRS